MTIEVYPQTIWLREYETMAEVCEAWVKDKQRIKELKDEYSLLLVRNNVLKEKLERVLEFAEAAMTPEDMNALRLLLGEQE